MTTGYAHCAPSACDRPSTPRLTDCVLRPTGASRTVTMAARWLLGERHSKQGSFTRLLTISAPELHASRNCGETWLGQGANRHVHTVAEGAASTWLARLQRRSRTGVSVHCDSGVPNRSCRAVNGCVCAHPHEGAGARCVCGVGPNTVAPTTKRCAGLQVRNGRRAKPVTFRKPLCLVGPGEGGAC